MYSSAYIFLFLYIYYLESVIVNGPVSIPHLHSVYLGIYSPRSACDVLHDIRTMVYGSSRKQRQRAESRVKKKE